MYKSIDKCPYCNSPIVFDELKNDQSFLCNGNNCSYIFYVKDSIEEAEKLFKDLKSYGNKEIFLYKSRKYLISAMDARIPKPFVINKLTDIIDKDYLTLLHRGFIEAINITDNSYHGTGTPATLMYFDISEPSNENKFEFLSTTVFHDEFCEYLYENKCTLNDNCRASCIQQVKGILKNEFLYNEDESCIFERRCAANKLHLLSPLVINKRIVGFIIFGGFLLKGDKILLNETIKNNLDEDKIKEIVKNAEDKPVTREFLNNLKDKVHENIEAVQDFILSIYSGKRQVIESYFFNFINERIFQHMKFNGQKIFNKYRFDEILADALGKINTFSRIHYSFLYLNDDLSPETFKLIASTKKSYGPNSKIATFAENDFLIGFFQNNRILYSSTTEEDEEFYKTFSNLFKDDKPLFWAMIPISVSKRRYGFIILVNRTTKIDREYKKSCSPAFDSFLVSLKREFELGLGILNYELKRMDDISNISHEIINPLDKIMGRIEFMQNNFDYIRSDEYKPTFILTLEDLWQKTKEMERKTNSIIHLTKEVLSLRLESTDLFEIVKHNVHMILPRAKIKKITINYKKMEELWIPRFLLNGEYFGSALFNVLENAVKYSNECSEIDMTMGAIMEEQNYFIDISNYGIGVLEKEKAEIFELGIRGSNARIDGGGLGRGLFIASDSLRKHKIIDSSQKHNTKEYNLSLILHKPDNPTIFRILIPFQFKA